MKQIIFSALFVLSVNIAFAQNEKTMIQAPAVVAAAFQRQFPQAANVKWEKETAGYEASFTLKGKEQSAVYDSKGILQETEVEIQASELPPAALTYIHRQYPGQAIKEATKITGAGGAVTYEAEVGKMDLIFDSKGAFLKMMKK